MDTRGYCGIGIVRSKNLINVGTLWRSAQCFGADFLFTVERRYEREPSDTMMAVKHIPLFHFDTIDDLKRHVPFDCLMVGVEMVDYAKELRAFRHPERACYLLGAEDDGLSDEALAACHRVVRIPGVSRCLNVASAGSIILYHRYASMARVRSVEVGHHSH